MQILTTLAASSTTVPDTPPSTHVVVHHEVAPGCFLHLGFGPEGLHISNGHDVVRIPLGEILRLAQIHQPAFIPR